MSFIDGIVLFVATITNSIVFSFTVMPYILRVLVSLAVILVINKVTRKLWLSLIGGVVILAFFSGHSVVGSASIALERVVSLDDLLLLVVVFQIICLGGQMSETGLMGDFVTSLRSHISRRAAMAVLPAVIGFLPMPGGAIFSAPLVDDCDETNSIDALLKTKINYWFRHVWEYWWPLYPGVLLAIKITGIPMLSFMVLQLPLCLLSILCGYFFLIRKIKGGKEDDYHHYPLVPFGKVIVLVMPLLLAMLSFVLIMWIFPGIVEVSQYIPVLCGIGVAQCALQVQRPLSLKSWLTLLSSRKTLMMVLLVAEVRIYGAFIEAKLVDGTFLVEHMRSELVTSGVPVVAMAVIIPYICGMTTGLAVGFVGASFPIVMSLLGNDPSPRELYSLTLLAYASGYMGMILCPVHICLIVTNQYFKTRLLHSIVGLSKPAVVLLACSFCLYLLYRYCPVPYR